MSAHIAGVNNLLTIMAPVLSPGRVESICEVRLKAAATSGDAGIRSGSCVVI